MTRALSVAASELANTLPPSCERCGSDHLHGDVCGCCGFCQECSEHADDCSCDEPARVRFAVAAVRFLKDY